MAETKHVEYTCSWCGRRVVKAVTFGRPDPGQCPKKGKTRNGTAKPHTWVINRKF